MLHYLRIAVTALSLTACVLLVVGMLFFLVRGRLVFYTLPNGGGPWRLEDHPRYAAVYEAVPGLPIAFGDVLAGRYVTIPHWFLVSASGAIALLMQWRYPYRVRLRTLLIVTTLVAVALAAIVYAAR